MRTQMHQEAFPGEDISDRPLPETVVPALLRLLELPSGRYRASDLLVGRPMSLATPAQPPPTTQARGLARDEVRLLVAGPRRPAPTPSSAPCRSIWSLATWSW